MAYEPTEWNTGDIITAEKLNNIEDGIIQNNTNIIAFWKGNSSASVGSSTTYCNAIKTKDNIVIAKISKVPYKPNSSDPSFAMPTNFKPDPTISGNLPIYTSMTCIDGSTVKLIDCLFSCTDEGAWTITHLAYPTIPEGTVLYNGLLVYQGVPETEENYM